MVEKEGQSIASAIQQIIEWSDVYRLTLRRHPELEGWLLGFGAARLDARRLEREWGQLLESRGVSASDDSGWPLALAAFRRRMSLLIAVRSVARVASEPRTLSDITAVAEFAIEKLFARCLASATAHYGEPWDEETDRPARVVVMAMGKLGGGELNFCSDVDLVYVYDGSGFCIKNEKRTSISVSEFFTRVCQEFSRFLPKRSAEGFLYNLDLRLRPEGDSGPLVRSLTAMENYYYVRGQTWERMAWIKARRVAGSAQLEEELLEAINPFRFPRHPPPALLESIAGVKVRIEKEVLGADLLERDIKNGRGGIREIEFFIQTLQMSRGGRLPFVRAENTLKALEALTRYGVLDSSVADLLKRHYLRLRRIENGLQMRAEEAVYALPSSESEREGLAKLLGWESLDAFDADVRETRDWVNATYSETFQVSRMEIEAQSWTLFFSEGKVTDEIKGQLARWFPEESMRERLRVFVLGDLNNAITRDSVDLFMRISESFDELLPRLAKPEDVLERIDVFARGFRARKEVLKLLASSPTAFEGIAKVFDRSRFIATLLSRRPEIFEEVMGQGNRGLKPIEVTREELSHLPSDASADRWIWLYVKAEHTRMAISESLDIVEPELVREGLTRLADAILLNWLKESKLDRELTLVAMGKYGGRELTYGSDLDLVIVGPDGAAQSAVRQVQGLLKRMRYSEPPGQTWEIDLRLRPHGVDGPMVTTLAALERYFDGGGARFWERMAYSRSRVVGGNAELSQAFLEFRNETVIGSPVTEDDIESIGVMRAKIQMEKAPDSSDCFDLKAGRGGLIDVEFLCQKLLLTEPALSSTIAAFDIRSILEQAASAGQISTDEAKSLQADYRFLRRLEQGLRRYGDEGRSKVDRDFAKLLAVWFEFPSVDLLWRAISDSMDRIREIVKRRIGAQSYPE